MDDRKAPANKGDLADLEQRLTNSTKGDLADLEQRLTNSTKSDLADLEQRLTNSTKSDLADLEQRLSEKIEILRSEVNHNYRDLVERMDDKQTELLRAFYTYATATNKHMVELDGGEAAIRSRLSTLEDRMLEVERRLNMPPAA